ncbi:MAG: family 14 glycosylhydrolase, partial [Phycicoccus sp.]
DYPTRGALQAYSPLAVQSFRAWALDRYQDLAGVARAWGTPLRSVEEINPPADPESFFALGDYRFIQYGKDFFDWYNASLVEHGYTVLSAALTALGDAFAGADFGFKVPGVHWTMGHPVWPRAAEAAAGLIRTGVPWDDSTGHGYHHTAALARQVQQLTTRLVVLHFTCLEMANEKFAPQYSQAQDLVFWMAQLADRLGVPIKGENALSGGVRGHTGWDNIDNAFRHAAYSGLTVLRLDDVVGVPDEQGDPGVGQERYGRFVADRHAADAARQADASDDDRPGSGPSSGLVLGDGDGDESGEQPWHPATFGPPAAGGSHRSQVPATVAVPPEVFDATAGVMPDVSSLQARYPDLDGRHVQALRVVHEYLAYWDALTSHRFVPADGTAATSEAARSEALVAAAELVERMYRRRPRLRENEIGCYVYPRPDGWAVGYPVLGSECGVDAGAVGAGGWSGPGDGEGLADEPVPRVFLHTHPNIADGPGFVAGLSVE